MVQHKMSRRELKQDAFVAYAKQIFEDLLIYKEKIIIVGIVILAIIAAVVSLHYQKVGIENTAFSALDNAKAKWKKENKAEGEQELKEIVNRYINIDAGVEAILMLSNYYYENKKFDEGIEISDKALKKIKKKSPVYSKLLLFQAYCYEGKKEYDFSLRRLQEFIEDFKDNYMAPEVYLSMARCYSLKNEKEKAMDSAKTVIQKYPDSVWAKQAEDFLV